MNILITGIYGFLGSNLANELQGDTTVVGLYNQNKKNELNNSIKVYNDLDEIKFKPDILILCHAAVVSGQDAVNIDKLAEINISLTKKILDKFPLAKCVYISSVSVYGENTSKLSENTIVNPISEYAKSKYLGEQVVLERNRSIIIRIASLYGNGMKENTLIPNYCNQAIIKNVIEVWGNGERIQNYIHVNDVVQLIKKSITYNNEASFIALGVSENEFSNNEVAKIIADETNSKIVFVNDDTSFSSCYDNVVTRNKLNWKPVINLNDGIKKYIKWKKVQ